MKMRNKLLAAFICISLSVSLLAGCGSSKSNTDSKSDANEKPTTAVTETESENEDSASAGKKITLTWLSHFQEAGKQAWVEYCKKVFEEKYPNVTVNIETVASDSYSTILQTKLASEDAPTIFDLGTKNDVTVYDNAGHLADLSNLSCLSLVDANLLTEGQIDGKQKGVPMEISGYGVFYNIDVFNQYGLSVPTTLSELTAVCETLAENGVVPFAAPFAEQWAFRYYLRAITDITCLYSDHNWYVDKMSQTSTFSGDQTFKDSLNKYFSFHKYWGDDPFGTSWDDAQNMVANGEAAMCIHGSWAVDGFLSKNPDCNIGVFAMPVSENPDDCIMIKEPGTQLVLYNEKDPDKLQAAYNLYNIVYSQECMEKYASEAHQMPSVTGDYDMPEALKTIMNYPADKSFMEAGITAYTSEYEDIFMQTLINYSMGDTLDVDGFCAEVDYAFAALNK